MANDAFGVPNAKISVFINVDNNDSNDVVKNVLYPYTTTSSRNNDNVRYNLLPNEQVNDCYTIIGTFPEKQYTLDNGDVLEIYNKYYKYTTRTNEAGDYMIFGVPTGSQTIHVDIDLSDIGILSQRPRDMVNKGYNIEQFENANKFKHDTNLESLTQVISQDTITDVIPFWGDTNENSIGISRCDINISYKFEPTCVFMGSVVSDTKSDGISKKCIPTSTMGAMDELTTGSGTIEMIRKTPSGDVEEFQIKGTQLINGDGVWCYQIPMNLDYMMTDEFGNMVPTNDPKKGIPTRTQVRFRISLQDFETDESNIFRCKMLVPHNPDIYSEACEDELDYQFGTKTKDSSFRDLYWNGIYSVKSYIPRIQKGNNPFNDEFTGFKRVNFNNGKNPIPYNNIRIKMPYAYTLACNTLKALIRINALLNRLIRYVFSSASFVSITGEICNENLRYLCVIPGINIKSMISNKIGISGVGEAIMRHYQIMKGDVELDAFTNDDITFDDIKSNEDTNRDTAMDDENLPRFEYTTRKSGRKKRKSYADIKMYGIRVTDKIDYFIQCAEMKLANEFKVIQFDFYNDWINGLIYIPRWMRTISQKKHTLRGKTYYTDKIDACNENYKSGSLNLVQQCGLTYKLTDNTIVSKPGCGKGQECHKHSSSRKSYRIFKQNGIVRTIENSKSQFLYYFKPCETSYDKNDKNVRLFATDIILLGTLNDCDKWGIPGNISELVSTTYQMPPNIALTDSEVNGVDYGANLDKEEFISMEYSFNKERVTSIDLGNCYVGINPVEDVSNYTELAGVSWDYTGPLQHAQNGIYGDLYRPGGHFLGMACNNVATNIKSCVNLSRICEYGVWMSQRQRLVIPTDNNNVEFYGIVPSGFISKDEISGTNYRRLFATMNKNRLRTKINPETGYPIYDFKYVNPTNFGGDMAGYFNYNELYRTNMNRLIELESNKGVIERYYDYDYIFGKHVLTRELKTNEKQIMRTGEFKDDEYLNYRFGLEGSYGHNEDNEKMKRFLIHENKTKYLSIENGAVSDVNFVSFPMYENSFYFYFGMHDGKTAIDEFKRTYYAVCKKNNDLVQINNSAELSDVNITYDGICESEGKGALKFNIKADDNLFNDDGFIVQIFNDSGYTYNDNIKDKTTPIEITGLTKGVYYVNITHGLLGNINETFTLEVKSISLNGSIISSDFIKFIDDKNTNTFNETDKETNGGYIKVNRYVYYENDGKTDKYDIFDNKIFKSLNIEFDKRNIDVTLNEDGKSLKCVYDGIDITMEINEEDEEYKIPIPFVDTEYTVKLTTLIDNCKLPTEIKDNLSDDHEWELGKVKVFNANRMDLFFNKVHWEILKDYAFDKEGNSVRWWENIDGNDFGDEDKMIKWYLKEALFQNEAWENAISNPHTIPITVVGGKAPYIENLSGMKNDGNTTFENASRFDYLYSITTPSIITFDGIKAYSIPKFDTYSEIIDYATQSVYIGDMVYLTKDSIYNNKTYYAGYYYIKGENDVECKTRINFTYQVKDINGQIIPENDKAFEFPSIYKPFCLKTMTWQSSNGVINFYGNIWNGITWTTEDGFNDIVLNGKKIDEKIGVSSSDISFVENSGTTYSINRYTPFSLNINEKEKVGYGLYNDKVSKFDLKIGSSHQEPIEEVTYDFSNHTILRSNNIYYAKFEKGLDESGNTIFNISNLNPDMYSIYLVDGNGDFSVTNLKNALPHIDNGGDKDYWFNLLLNDNYSVEVNGNIEKIDFYNHSKTFKMTIKNKDGDIIDKGDRNDIEFKFDEKNKVYSATMKGEDFKKYYFVVVLDKNKINAKKDEDEYFDVLSYTTNSLSQLTAFSISEYINT